MQVCNLHATCFEITHAMSMSKSDRKFEICCLFMLASRAELCYSHIILTRTTTEPNFEVTIFKLCGTIIVVQHTGVQWAQKHTKYTKGYAGLCPPKRAAGEGPNGTQRRENKESLKSLPTCNK